VTALVSLREVPGPSGPARRQLAGAAPLIPQCVSVAAADTTGQTIGVSVTEGTATSVVVNGGQVADSSPAAVSLPIGGDDRHHLRQRRSAVVVVGERR
jgi:hypothetical protein